MDEKLLKISAYNLRARDVENRALKGWKKIGIATIVIIFVILICVQYAFNVPVWDSMSSDKKALSKYSKSQIMLSKIILGAVAVSLAAGVYIIFEACQWSFECLLQGGKAGQQKIRNSGLEQSKRMANITNTQLQMDRATAEQSMYNQQPSEEQSVAFDIAMQKQQMLEQQKIQNLQNASDQMMQPGGMQRVMQPGVQGVTQPGMQGVMQPGMQGVMQTGMQPSSPTEQQNTKELMALLGQAGTPGQATPSFGQITS